MADPKLLLNPVTLMFTDTAPAVSQPTPVTSANPLPVTLTSGSTDQDVNIVQVLGAAPSATNPLWVQFGVTTTLPFTRATINITTATTTAVVSATASQTTRVLRVMLNFAATQTLDIRSASTSLVGAPMTFGQGAGLILDFQGTPWFVTATNEALNFVTSTTGAITGFVDYVKSA